MVYAIQWIEYWHKFIKSQFILDSTESLSTAPPLSLFNAATGESVCAIN